MIIRSLLALVWFLLLSAQAVASSGGHRSITQGKEQHIQDLILPYRLGQEVSDGIFLENIQVEQRAISYHLGRPGHPDSRAVVVVSLLSRTDSEGRIYRIDIRPGSKVSNGMGKEAARRIVAVIRKKASTEFWDEVAREREGIADSKEASPSPRSLPGWSLDLAGGKALGGYCFLATLLVCFLVSWFCRYPRFRELWEKAGAACYKRRYSIAIGFTALGVIEISIFVIIPAMLHSGQLDGGSPQWKDSLLREKISATISFLFVVTSVVVALWAYFSREVRERSRWLFGSQASNHILVHLAIVLAWSLFVRFVLTTPNILTDGGSGYRRLSEYIRGFGGMSVLIHHVLPSAANASIDGAIFVMRFMSAFSPPMLLVLGRTLGVGRRNSLFAGLCFASIPLHAVLYSSDFMLGSIMTVQLFGLTMLAVGVKADNPAMKVAAGAVLGFTLWCRPEAVIVMAVLAAMILVFPNMRKPSAALIVAAGVFVANGMAAFVAAICSRPVGGGGAFSSAGESITGFAETTWEYLPEHFAVPFWLSIALPFGVYKLIRHQPKILFLGGVGVFAGLVPSYWSGFWSNWEQNTIELFRYGTWSLPWILLLSSAGLVSIVEIAGTTARKWKDGAFERSSKVAVFFLLLAAVLTTPLFNLGYMATKYGPSTEKEVFIRALNSVPVGGWLVVPDEDPGLKTGSIEITTGYRKVLEECSRAGIVRPFPNTILSVNTVLDSISKVQNQERQFCSLPEGREYYFFRGAFCETGQTGTSPENCREIGRYLDPGPVFQEKISYISHRLVAKPFHREKPLFFPDLELSLWSMRLPCKGTGMAPSEQEQ